MCLCELWRSSCLQRSCGPAGRSGGTWQLSPDRQWAERKQTGTLQLRAATHGCNVLVWYLCNGMMAFHDDGAHGRGHTHHLQSAACAPTDVGACSDAGRHRLRRPLLTGGDHATTDLNRTTFMLDLRPPFFLTFIQSLLNHVYVVVSCYSRCSWQ